MSEAGSDRIHPPTARRREQARQQGQVARSRDLVACSVLIAGAIAAWLLGGPMVQMLEQVAVTSFGLVPRPLPPDQAAAWGQNLMGQVATVLIPVLVLLFLAALTAQLVQTGVLFLPRQLAADLQRIDPRANARRMLALQNGLRIAWAAAKLLIILAIVGWAVANQRQQLLGLGAADPHTIATSAARLLGSVASTTLLALLLLASLDYAWQRRCHERSLWMTEQELREQWQEEQVDPQIHRRRSQLQQKMALQQIAGEVSQAHLVLIAGTSLAVALRYDPNSMAAPQMLVKGTGQQAAEIYRVGQQQGIATVDDGTLARELYRRVPRGSELPTDTYPAIAAHLIEMPRFRTASVVQRNSAAIPVATDE